MIRIFITTICLLSLNICYSQAPDKESITILFHNCDNFFDTVNDPGDTDDNYTPTGLLQWNEERYNSKKEEIASILSQEDRGEIPGIIILSGIENIQVAKDIFNSKKIRRDDYIVAGGLFYPGSGVVLAIRKGSAELLESRPVIPEIDPELSDKYLISYNRIRLNDGAVYYVFINEWSSASQGGISGEMARKFAAVSLRKEIDYILNAERDARILVVGSFNDEPTNASIMTILNASGKRKNLADRDLYNPFFDLHNRESKGTIEVNGSWQMYDYFIVSPSLLKQGSMFSTGYDDGRVADQYESFGPTYRGYEYAGGSGSHLPVFLRLSRIKAER